MISTQDKDKDKEKDNDKEKKARKEKSVVMDKELKSHIEDMEEVMHRTADRCDIWQDRFIYAMARAIWYLLLREAKR